MRISRDALRRAAVLVAVGLALAATCSFLGRWQWDKHVARDALIATVDANWSAPAVPLASVAPVPGDAPAAGDEWLPVAVTGHYLASSGVLLRNRPVNGEPAYHVLVPFQTDGGAVLVVDRGWVPLGSDGQTVSDVPAPPSGTVDLVARLRMPEGPSDRSAPPGQVQTFDPTQIVAAGGLPTTTVAYRWYAEAVTESPAPATALGALETPSTDPGPYLSYAVQWWVFAVAGLFAFGWMARREVLDDLAGRPSALARAEPGAAVTATATAAAVAPRPATRPAPLPPRRGRGRDELAEDAIVDGQLSDQGR